MHSCWWFVLCSHHSWYLDDMSYCSLHVVVHELIEIWMLTNFILGAITLLDLVEHVPKSIMNRNFVNLQKSVVHFKSWNYLLVNITERRFRGSTKNLCLSHASTSFVLVDNTESSTWKTSIFEKSMCQHRHVLELNHLLNIGLLLSSCHVVSITFFLTFIVTVLTAPGPPAYLNIFSTCCWKCQ